MVAVIAGKKVVEGEPCLVPMSITQPYHEKPERLEEIVAALSESKVGDVVFLLGDSNENYNLRIEDPTLSEIDAIAKARQIGDTWLQSNKALLYSLENLSPRTCNRKVTIIRWEEYLLSEEMRTALNTVKRRQEEENPEYDAEFSNKVSATINFSLAKYSETHPRATKTETKRAKKLIRGYVEEELALFLVVSDRFACRNLTYPIASSKVSVPLFTAFARLPDEEKTVAILDTQFSQHTKKRTPITTRSPSNEHLPIEGREAAVEAKSKVYSNGTADGLTLWGASKKQTTNGHHNEHRRHSEDRAYRVAAEVIVDSRHDEKTKARMLALFAAEVERQEQERKQEKEIKAGARSVRERSTSSTTGDKPARARAGSPKHNSI